MPTYQEAKIIATVLIPADDSNDSNFSLELRSGQSVVLIGANGAGKTRLGVFIEDNIAEKCVTRIAAHRSLVMSDTLAAIALDRAMNALAYGRPDAGPGSRRGNRWHNKPAIAMLNDFDFLQQALFSENSRVAVEHLQAHRVNPAQRPPETKLVRLVKLWERLLPHRKLKVKELGVAVVPSGSSTMEYPGSEMSDGERVIFYMLGQCLLARPDSVIIIDEPELHVHKAILSRLWDTIEAERSDCSFVYVSHDLDFVVARPTATKVLVRSYMPEPRWQLDQLPTDTGLPDRVVTELIGSRQPILFVEGTRGSLDKLLYQSIFPDHLIEPIGPCDAVIHAVRSFRKNLHFHRLSVQGFVDSDGRDPDHVEYLLSIGVHVLPVAEVENILLLPSVFEQLAIAFQHSKTEASRLVTGLTEAVAKLAKADLESAATRFAARQLDAALKKLAPSAKTVSDLDAKFQDSLANINVDTVAATYKARLSQYIDNNNLAGMLELLDNKGLLSEAAKVLGIGSRENLRQWLGRLLNQKEGRRIRVKMRAALPSIAGRSEAKSLEGSGLASSGEPTAEGDGVEALGTLLRK
ncbi:ABC transporter ATP-binding protein [Methylocystis sp. MitZ-2018]|nr:ABC transporter ATP-binding protein [Methylocystis sp. MitZ-2018]